MFNKKPLFMKKNFILFCLSLLLIIACSPKSDYNNSVYITYKDFKEVEKLESNVLIFDSLIMKPFSMQKHDTVLIIRNLNTEKIFQLFNLNTDKEIGQRISVGQGPNEMLSPFFVSCDTAIILFDMSNSTISKFTVEDFIHEKDPTPYEKIKLAEQILSEIVMLGDEIIGSLYHSEAPYYKFDENGNKTTPFGSYPVSNLSYSESELASAYFSAITSNSLDKVAVSHFWSDLISIYDKNGTLIKNIHGPEHFYPHLKTFDENGMTFSKAVPGKSRDAFYCPISIGNNLFVLFNGKDPYEKEYNTLSKRILVYSWDGVPQKIYELDRGVSRIIVDEKNKKIYGITSDPEYMILEFSYS